MQKALATIVTESHVPWALSLYESTLKFDINLSIYILITDSQTNTSSHVDVYPNLKFLYINDLFDQPFCKAIIDKYTPKPDYLRWSLKPILINYLLSQNIEKVMFCDCDIYFFNDFEFIWNELDSANVLLTPHWFDHTLPQNIHTLHTTGIINGGFLAVAKGGIEAMRWWASMCLDKCDSKFGTINVDQGYLEMMPFFFDNVKILKHKGLNVSYWSNNHLIRVKKDNNFYIDDSKDTFPLVFYHFAANKYKQFLNEEIAWFDILVKLNESLKKFGYKRDIVELAKLQNENKHLSFKSKLLNKFKTSIPYRIRKLH
jgi:hypothetical protein